VLWTSPCRVRHVIMNVRICVLSRTAVIRPIDLLYRLPVRAELASLHIATATSLLPAYLGMRIHGRGSQFAVRPTRQRTGRSVASLRYIAGSAHSPCTARLTQPKRIHPRERVMHIRVQPQAPREPNRILTRVLPRLRVVVSESIVVLFMPPGTRSH